MEGRPTVPRRATLAEGTRGRGAPAEEARRADASQAAEKSPTTPAGPSCTAAEAFFSATDAHASPGQGTVGDLGREETGVRGETAELNVLCNEPSISMSPSAATRIPVGARLYRVGPAFGDPDIQSQAGETLGSTLGAGDTTAGQAQDGG